MDVPIAANVLGAMGAVSLVLTFRERRTNWEQVCWSVQVCQPVEDGMKEIAADEPKVDTPDRDQLSAT